MGLSYTVPGDHPWFFAFEWTVSVGGQEEPMVAQDSALSIGNVGR